MPAPRARHVLAVTVLLAATLVPRWAFSDPEPAASATTTEASPVSATGLLPVFGVSVDPDAAGKPEQAVPAMQKLWDQYLKGAGFNVIQFPVEVRELGDKGAGRLAKLCVWAKANNLRLAPILVGAPLGEPLPDDFADKAGAFAAKTFELVGKEGDPQAYAQIMLYQIERPLNHPASHGPGDASKMATVLKAVVEKVRASEQTALAGSSLQATPVLASASFDYELIRFGAIAHVPITDEAYQQAYGSLREYLTAVVSAAPIDVIQIEWFPGSLSSEAVDRMPDLVTKLQADFPGKLLVIGTGYSTAAGAEADQSRYYTQAFNNLSDLRTNQGVESSLAGILWRNAQDRPGGAPKPPSSKTPEEMAKWNWPERAAEVTRMWNEPGAESKDMRWWLGHVDSHFGLLATTKDASKSGEPKLSYELLAHLKTSLAAAAQSTGAGEIAQQLQTEASGKGGIIGAVKDRLQSALFGMLDVWVAKTAENLVSGGSSSNDGGGLPPVPPPPTPTPSAEAVLEVLTLGDIGLPKVGQATTFPLTVKNNGTAVATNVKLYLHDGPHDLGFSSTSTLAPEASSIINVIWTPDHPGEYHDITVEAVGEGDPTPYVVALGDLHVDPASGGGGGGGGGHGGIRGGGIVLDPGMLHGVKGTLATSTAAGFVRIESIRSMTPVMTPMMMSGKAPIALSGTTTGGAVPRMGGTGGGTTGGSTGGTIRGEMPRSGGTGGRATGGVTTLSKTGGPEPISLVFSISNPFNYNFTQVSAVLKIEGKQIATKDLGTLYPLQRRTVAFAQWTPPKPGTFPVLIELKGFAPTGRVLLSTATDQIVVQGSSPGTTSTRSLAITGTGGTTGGGTTPRLMTTTRLITPMMIRTTSMPLMKPTQTRSLYMTPGTTRSLTASLFGLTANSLVIDPFPPPIGSDVSFSVRLFNSDRAVAKKVKVEGFVDGDKLGETTLDVPIARAVVATGFNKWKAKPGRHSFRAVVTQDTKSANATRTVDVRPAGRLGAGGVAALLGRGAIGGTIGGAARLAITSTDIRLSSIAPQAGADVTLSVRLQNVGGSAATGARAELFADGVRLGEATANIAAGGEAILTGFPVWKPAAGNHALLCRATLAGIVVEARRDVSVGAPVLLMKQVSPTIGTKVLGGGFATMATIARPDLQITPGDITFNPAMPKANSALTITIAVRNLGAAAASDGSVLGILTVDGAEVTRRQFPAALAASGTTTLTWQVTAPSGKQLAVSATASTTNDAQPANNQATAMASIAILLQKIDPGLLYVPEIRSR